MTFSLLNLKADDKGQQCCGKSTTINKQRIHLKDGDSSLINNCTGHICISEDLKVGAPSKLSEKERLCSHSLNHRIHPQQHLFASVDKIDASMLGESQRLQ